MGAHPPREREGQRGAVAPRGGREQHHGQRAPGPGGHEIFGQFAPGRIAAADDDSLEREARQQEALKPAGPSGWPGLSRWFRAVHARQVSTSAAKEARPRIGRSEERRVGNESVGTCRYRWSPTNSKNKQKRQH